MHLQLLPELSLAGTDVCGRPTIIQRSQYFHLVHCDGRFSALAGLTHHAQAVHSQWTTLQHIQAPWVASSVISPGVYHVLIERNAHARGANMEV